MEKKKRKKTVIIKTRQEEEEEEEEEDGQAQTIVDLFHREESHLIHMHLWLIS